MQHPPQVAQLMAAAGAVLAQVQNGELFLSAEPYISRNCTALDDLQDALDALTPSHSGEIANQ